MDIEESKKSIRKTVIYSDIFDYPLTLSQLYTFLIAKKTIPKEQVKKILSEMKEIKVKDGYVFLRGRESLVSQRKEKAVSSEKKLSQAKKIASILSFIPTILFIGVSGGVAMQNAKQADDIDLFIITKKDSVWVTRLIVVLILGCLGKLRTRTMTQISDKFCVNMFLGEDAIAFPIEKQNVYIAHEVAQVVPLVGRNDTYAAFCQANIWVKQFLPHVFLEKRSGISITDSVLQQLFLWIVTRRIIEKYAGIIQKQYMKKSITNETVQDDFLAFHPFDYAKNTLRIYNKRIHEEI